MNSKFKNIIPKFFGILILGLITLMPDSNAQSMLTINECYDLARNNFPLVKQLDLIDKSKDYTVSNAAKGNFPQFSIVGQATYQSDVTSIPISLPGMTIEPLSKDQYRIYGEVYQPLTDFSNVGLQKDAVRASAEIDKQKVEVELYKLKERVNQLFFSVLVLDAQLSQSKTTRNDIDTNLKRVNAAIQNGTANHMNADVLRAEGIKIDQRITEIIANRSAAISMMGALINQKLDDKTVFVKPSVINISDEVNRPELKMYSYQKDILKVQSQQVNSKIIPRLGLFFQGGYGKPALNVLKNDFSTYYIGGLRLNWNLNALYTRSNDKSIIENNRMMIDLQRDNFLLNTSIVSRQQNTEIVKYNELIKTDAELIALRESIKKTATTQLENGVISPLDYISFLNAEDQAKQNLATHEIQLLQAQYNLNTTLGY